MGLMDRMMDRMITNMSVEEKEKMMLKMRPMMMEDLDINKMMPDMMVRMGRLITPTGVGVFISKAANDDEFKEELGESLNGLKERLPELAEMMRDMMAVMMSLMSATGLMNRMMNTMGSLMPVMMPMMRIMMNEKMPQFMAENENVRQLMPEMMMEVMPECIDMMLPTVAPEDRAAFLSRLTEKMGHAASLEQSPDGDKDDRENGLVGKVAAGFESGPG